MKYQNLNGFEKHLLEAFPNHLSRVYIIGCAHEADRRKIGDKIVSLIAQKEGEAKVLRFHSDSNEVQKVLDVLNTRPLFSPSHIVVFEPIENLSKEDLSKLSAYCCHPASFSYLILGGKSDSSLYQKGKKEAVFLDLSHEKSWEREKRLKEWLLALLKQEKKSASADAITYLLEEVGSDWSALEQEAYKLIIFSGDKKMIECADARAVSSVRSAPTGWQIAEGVVWNEAKNFTIEELAILLPLIGQLRYHLQLGLQLLLHMREGRVLAECFPALKSYALEKYAPLAKKRGEYFFRTGLQALFEMELMAKSSSFAPSLLFDRFLARLYVSSLT